MRFAPKPSSISSAARAQEFLRLRPADTSLMEAMMTTFGEVFDDLPTYTGARPSKGYMRRLLQDENFIALAAVMDGDVVGGLAAYNLQKFERERSEVYIYDLAVLAAHRRQAIATALIDELGSIAAELGAHVIFVQADHGDEPAIAL